MTYVYDLTESTPHISGTVADNTTVTAVDLPAGTRAICIQAQTNGVWFTLDGTTPSTSNGLFLPAGTMPLFLPIGASQLKWISAVAAGAQVDILCLS